MDFAAVILQYGLEIGIVAIATILLVGCVKALFRKGLDKIDKKNRKPIYETLSIVLAYGLVAVWLALKPIVGLGQAFAWQEFVKIGSLSYTAVKVIYPLYENYKVRDLVRAVLATFVKLFSKKVEKTISAPVVTPISVVGVKKEGAKKEEVKNSKTIVL